MKAALFFLAALGGLHAYDLGAAQAQTDPGKRSELALENADRELDAARAAYEAGNLAAYQAALAEVRESVDLSLTSLNGSHKKPRRSKAHKSAELRVRSLQRRVSSLRDQVSVDDRKPIEDLQKRLGEVHDELLAEIMGGSG